MDASRCLLHHRGHLISRLTCIYIPTPQSGLRAGGVPRRTGTEGFAGSGPIAGEPTPLSQTRRADGLVLGVNHISARCSLSRPNVIACAGPVAGEFVGANTAAVDAGFWMSSYIDRRFRAAKACSGTHQTRLAETCGGRRPLNPGQDTRRTRVFPYGWLVCGGGGGCVDVFCNRT